MYECIEKKKRLAISANLFFQFVGVKGFEPSTTRPPDVYSNRAELHPERFEWHKITCLF